MVLRCPKRCGQHGSPANKLLLLAFAVCVGSCVGLALRHTGVGDDHWSVRLLALPGRLWLKALRCVVLPMVVFSMVESMVMLRSLPGARYLGFMVVGFYLLTTVAAAGQACVVSVLILSPNVKPLPFAAAAADLAVERRGLLETLDAAIDNLVPRNLVGDAAADNLLPVIVASIVFGLKLKSKQEDGSDSPTLRLIRDLNHIVVIVVTGIMSLTPVGVCSLVLQSAARLDFGMMGSNVVLLMAATACSLLVHAWVVYPLLLLVITGRNPARYFMNIVPALATALGTSSSVATLPLSIECAVERNEISRDIAHFVLSLGAAVNMDGTTIYLICATCFLGALHGLRFGPTKLALTMLLATLCSVGSAPIPSASLALLATMLTALGIPLDASFGLITAADWILDRLRTCVNIAGDACAAGLVDGSRRCKTTEAVPV